MNGILVIDKPKNCTSRDVVNKVGKIFNTKKVGHTGTLDPIATGVLVLTLGDYTKLSEIITSEYKEYIASVILGIKTDTLDITGNILEEEKINIKDEEIKNAINKMQCTYMQEVPIYSAVKINGKKLYEYARNNQKVELPKRKVTIKQIELVSDIKRDNDKIYFDIKCLVSKGTYIRSLIRDIAYDLNTYGTMKNLVRTKQGIFSLEDSYTLEDIQNDNYKLLTIREVLSNIPVTIIEGDTLKKVQNGMSLPIFFNSELSLLIDHKGREIAIYKKEGNMDKPYKMIEVNNE